MPNMTVTDIDVGSVVMGGNRYAEEVIAFAGADILAPGTILARNTSTQKLQLYVKGGSSNGNGIPIAVLTYRIEATGAGDIKASVCTGGDLDLNRLVIDADGSNVNIDAAVRDLLKDQGFYTKPVFRFPGYDQHY